ncbi:hypothetical protein FB45DRAFT_84701 [Roridomyces roridus]|uniref:TPX2 C-terminal domain-containing protein n=1 Tax=Roridomyces roridus TaxID=1738132 RepID=A0AAD7BLN3_9AGAR|nr:hypothetical protein FB45DRAFT_84701 [Roridomyces roridus]
MDRREDVVQADTPNDDEDKDRPLTVSQLSPRKVQSGPETKPDEAEGEAEAAVRAPSPMRPAAKHPRPASVASHTGTGAIKKSRVDVSGAARGPSAARGRGRARVVSAPPRQAAPVGVRKTVTGVRKVSQPTISSSRWSRTTTSTRSQGDSGSGSKAPVASSSSGSKHTVINATATVPGEDAPTDGSKSKGYTIPDFKAMHASLALRRSQAAAPLVTPTPFSFSTDMRVKERHAFDAQVKVREEEKERERERERREREATEEDEVREMRRRAVPKAHEVPEWYKEAPKRAREA